VIIDRISEKWAKTPLEIKASTAYAACSILQKSMSFITLPLFTRLLTTEQYGQSTIYGSWQGILAIFLTLNLAYGSFSTAMIKFEEHRDEYISSVEGICILLTGIFWLIYLPFNNIWNRIFELPTYIVEIMLLDILTGAGLQFWIGKKRFEYKYKSIIAVTLLISILSPVMQYFFVISTVEKGYARIVASVLVNVILGGFLFFRNIQKGKKIINKEYWKFALNFNIPLIVYYLSQVIFNQSDRIMISHICGNSDVALYGVAYNLALVLQFVLNAINNSYVPWYYQKLKENRQKENVSVSCGIAILMAVLLLSIIWFAPEIILILAGDKYKAAVYVVAPVAMSLLLLFYAQLFINVEFYFEKKKALVGASVGAALVNIVLNALFIPRLGFVAAGYTTLISYLIFAVANYFAVKSILRNKGMDMDAYNIKALIGIFMLFLFISFLGVALYGFLILRIFVIIIALMIIIMFRRKIMKYARKLISIRKIMEG